MKKSLFFFINKINNMINLPFEKLNQIILQSSIIKSNEDVNKIIYNLYKIPKAKFKKNESCVRYFANRENEFVCIDSIIYIEKNNSYFYKYSNIFSPTSEGYCDENNLRKLY